ncbi:YeeE/YedE thiosulfate transporter family protein [Paenibacillus thiaminolyticus]|uniref:YeeE/YedE thiosulfate transporter family protein n=1 Tax=Paenibacillus thiaminolyticus TaxID=49283 RepID=UPI00233129B6|nr:YeeE/YedE thiosulfate transporter family protein [Paenibacillus thiaminolyticus]WCF05798.1 YeeE/YedE thiosulfate transporter family protein [Paenibacillus thiaminolyticus]
MGQTPSPATKSTRTRAPRKPKKSQLPYALLATALVIAFGFYLNRYNDNMVIYLLFGLSFGVILQRARFCFTASMRDPCITGSTSVTRAVLVACSLATIGFTAIKYSAYMQGNPIPGMDNVGPISFALVIGAVLFGIGMVIAGGCASGTLMRVGEGFTMQMISLFFFVLGSLWGAHDMGWWRAHVIKDAPAVFLPDVFGWLGALIVQFLIILLLYIASVKWQEKKMGSAE